MDNGKSGGFILKGAMSRRDNQGSKVKDHRTLRRPSDYESEQDPV